MKIIHIFFFAVLFFVFGSIFKVHAATYTVGSGSSINQAIEGAGNGDTISVQAGTYREKVDINKQITLTNAGDGMVWIDGECSRSYGIRVTSGNVTVKDIGVKKTTKEGIFIENAPNVTIEGNTIQDYNCQDSGTQSSAGVASKYSGSTKVLNNRITRRVEIGGSQKGQGNGIWFKSTSSNPSGGGHLISGNTIVGGYDGIGGEGEDDTRGLFDRDTVIENNTVSDCNDDGIQVEGGNVNIRVRNNKILRCALGIASAPNLVGPLYIENNTIIEGSPGHYGNVACFKIGDNGQGTTYYTGNYCDVPGDGWAETNDKTNTIISRNNTIKTNRYVIEIESLSSGAYLDFDNDCLYTSDSTRFVKYLGGVRYGSLSEFQSKTGQEKNGRSSASCEASASSNPAPTSAPANPTPTQTPKISTPAPTKTPTPKLQATTPVPQNGNSSPNPTSKPISTPTPTPKAQASVLEIRKNDWFKNMFSDIMKWFKMIIFYV